MNAATKTTETELAGTIMLTKWAEDSSRGDIISNLGDIIATVAWDANDKATLLVTGDYMTETYCNALIAEING